MVQAQQAMAVPVKFTARAYIPEQEGSHERWLQVLAGFQEDAQLSLCLGAAAISPGLRLLGCDSYISKASVLECAAALDIIVAKKHFPLKRFILASKP